MQECSIEIRVADSSDSDLLLEWRNDPETRAHSISQGRVDSEVHERWFTSALTDPNRLIVIGLCDGEPMGMCRFDVDSVGATAEVSINVNPLFRGRGLAAPMLSVAIEEFHRVLPEVRQLTAQIQIANSASTALFTRIGFRLVRVTDGLSNYSRDVAP